MMINFRTLTIEQLIQLLNETGYETTSSDFAFATENDLFKYIGCVDGAARYMVGYEDEETEGLLYMSIVYVTIACDKLVADYGGVPEFETNELDKLVEYFEKRGN